MGLLNVQRKEQRMTDGNVGWENCSAFLLAGSTHEKSLGRNWWLAVNASRPLPTQCPSLNSLPPPPQLPGSYSSSGSMIKCGFLQVAFQSSN